MNNPPYSNIFRLAQLINLLLLVSVLFGSVVEADDAVDTELEQFKTAWGAAGRGDHDDFRRIMLNLKGYVLYPYLQYEDYRSRRASMPADEMAAFLDANQDLAFANGLRRAWLKSLAKTGRWSDLLAYSEDTTDTVLRCQRARAQIILKQTVDLLADAQGLWAVGKSQPDECDPVFAWLKKNDGISPGLAWERIRLAMVAGNSRLTLYLARYIPKHERRWLESWQNLSRTGYARLDQARSWPDSEITRMITEVSLQRLARKDAAMAAEKFERLDGRIKWGEFRRATILKDIALYSAVALDEDTAAQMQKVPAEYRDSQLLEWWSRFLLSERDWPGLIDVIGQMPEDVRDNDRWLYWLVQAELRSGQTANANGKLTSLADKANYYGFLAADELGLPYSICPVQPDITAADIGRVAGLQGFQRALELRKADLDNWALAEWSAAVRVLPVEDLKVAAALAIREGWDDRAIFALGNSGDLQFYEWRFPLLWEQDIEHNAAANKLDPAWVYGIIRSESAMVETARSGANAIGLMQLTPATAKRVAKKHKLPWNGSEQLKQASGNLPLGTAFMGDLMQDYRHNPVLVSAAYNAGPKSVRRWLDTRPMGEAAIWVETLPYFETRDYIPRVLAFTTIYAWRMGGDIERISNRMPDIDSGKIGVNGSTAVVCRE